MYNDIAITPKTLVANDAAAIIADVNFGPIEQRRGAESPPERFTGFLVLLEADSTDVPGEYRLNHEVLVRDAAFAKAKPSRRQAPFEIHAQFKCAYPVHMNSLTAFLVPLTGDEYMVVLSTFALLGPGGAPLPLNMYHKGS